MKLRRNGFTLIELLVVLAIIAILAIVLLTQFDIIKRIQQALGLRSTVQMKEVEKALYRYYVNHDAYPGNFDEAGINVVIPDILNHTQNSEGNYYIQPTPATSIIDNLIKDKELKSAAKHTNYYGDLSHLDNFIFVAARKITPADCESYVQGKGEHLESIKMCRKTTARECQETKEKIKNNQLDETSSSKYYTICEAGGAMVAIIPVKEVYQYDQSWYNWFCQDTSSFKYWIYYCQ